MLRTWCNSLWDILTPPKSIVTHNLARIKLWQTMLGRWRSSAFLVHSHLQTRHKQPQKPANDWLLHLVHVPSRNDLHVLNHVASTHICLTCLLHTIMTLWFVMFSVLEFWSSGNVTSVHLQKWEAWQLSSSLLCFFTSVCKWGTCSDGSSVCMAGTGRGYTVTQAVKSGTLLAVGKPLGINKVSVSESCLLHSCCVTRSVSAHPLGASQCRVTACWLAGLGFRHT